MKLLAIAAATGLVIGTLGVSAPAEAQRHHDRGERWKTVCKTRWVHHRKVRKCTKVRVRWDRHR